MSRRLGMPLPLGTPLPLGMLPRLALLLLLHRLRLLRPRWLRLGSRQLCQHRALQPRLPQQQQQQGLQRQQGLQQRQQQAEGLGKMRSVRPLPLAPHPSPAVVAQQRLQHLLHQWCRPRPLQQLRQFQCQQQQPLGLMRQPLGIHRHLAIAPPSLLLRQQLLPPLQHLPAQPRQLRLLLLSRQVSEMMHLEGALGMRLRLHPRRSRLLGGARGCPLLLLRLHQLHPLHLQLAALDLMTMHLLKLAGSTAGYDCDWCGWVPISGGLF
mmetsp:Transcript_8427/g.21046  ORF Transcript_8427/g.21046 Transcript_8427/m.21046 type:complete len:266 (+) Transcript_8427:2042-2839(+)